MRAAATTTRCCARGCSSSPIGSPQAVGPFGHRVFTDSAPVLEVELAARSGHRLARQAHAGARPRGRLDVLPRRDLRRPGAAADARRSSAHCGSCSACIDVCPTQAHRRRRTGSMRAAASRTSRSSTTGRSRSSCAPLIGNRIYGCDDCQLVCPWNKFAQVASRCPTSMRAPASPSASPARAVGLERGRLPAPHRGQRDPPHRPRALAAQPRGRRSAMRCARAAMRASPRRCATRATARARWCASTSTGRWRRPDPRVIPAKAGIQRVERRHAPALDAGSSPA